MFVVISCFLVQCAYCVILNIKNFMLYMQMYQNVANNREASVGVQAIEIK